MSQTYRASWQRWQKPPIPATWHVQKVSWCQVKGVGALGVAAMEFMFQRGCPGLDLWPQQHQQPTGVLATAEQHFLSLLYISQQTGQGWVQSQGTQSNSQPKLVIFHALLNKENWGKGILGDAVSVIGCRLAAHQSTCGSGECFCIIFTFSPTLFLHLSVSLKPRALVLLFLTSFLYYWHGQWPSSCST